MNNEEKILEILQQMNERLNHIEEDISSMKEDIEDVKEGQEEIRDSVNTLIEWADKVSRTNEFPLPEVLGA